MNSNRVHSKLKVESNSMRMRIMFKKNDRQNKHLKKCLHHSALFLSRSLLLSTLFLLVVGIRQSHASIIDSLTEISRSINRNCSRIEPSYDITRAGQTAFRHRIDRCGERAELEMRRTEIGRTYWYGWSMFVPLDWSDTDPGFDIVNQFAAWPSRPGRRYPCGGVGSKISRRGSNFILDFQRRGDNVDAVCTNYTLARVSEIRGQWTDFIVHVKWTGNNDGFFRLWMKTGSGDYIQKVNYQGATFWNDEGTGPYFKMGLYKGNSNFSGPAPRIIYTDEYRLGDANSSFGQVAP